MKKEKKSSNYQFFNNKSILVTGGTGSFGSSFVKTILKYSNPKRLVIYSRDEYKQSELKKELINQIYSFSVQLIFLALDGDSIICPLVHEYLEEE